MSGIFLRQFWLQGLRMVLVSAIVLSAKAGEAQITPDGTVPTNVQFNGSIFNITEGTRAGGNLFHSFREFSIPTGGEAFFNNAVDVQNIISRVTGGSISNIDGLIRANGTANLFLINPYGIIFGQNASLNVGGSFVASTASGLKFADGTFFSATSPQTTPLLTLSVPIGLQFGQTQGRILVQGQSQPLALPPSSLAPFQTEQEAIKAFEDVTTARLTASVLINSILSRPSGLQVSPGKTLVLVGGDVNLDGGHVTAIGGSIEIGSVAEPSLVSLNSTNTGWSLGYENVQNFNNVLLSNQASLNTTGEGSGNIQIVGQQVTLTNESSIFGGTLGSLSGREVSIRASQIDIGTSSVILTGTTTSGKGGNVLLQSQKLVVSDGAGVITGSLGSSERGGNLIVQTTDSVTVSKNSLLTTSSLGIGSAGDISIETGSLSIQNAGKILTATAGFGNAGTLSVGATDSITVAANGFLSASTASAGNGGSLNITTKNLIIQNGGVVSSATSGQGRGGILSVNASDSVQVLGTSLDGKSPSNLDVLATNTGAAGNLMIKTGQLIVGDGAQISASTTTTGNAGNLMIETGQMSVQNGSRITVSSESASAGNLEISARSIKLDNNAKLVSETASGNGGNITLQAQDLLLLRNSSQISTTAGIAQQSGDGGNITINTPNGFIVAVDNENSDITANAFTGRGGRVDITASGIFGIQPRPRPTTLSDITASSDFGISGVVTINTSPGDFGLGLVELTADIGDASKLVSSSCTAFANGQASEFIVTGRGGLPPSPDEPLTNDIIWTDTRIPTITAQHQPQTAVKPSPKNHAVAVVPATGWVFNGKGEVTLISASNTANLGNTNAACGGL